jgi:hypothetical protein
MKIILEFSVPEKAEDVDVQELGDVFHNMIDAEYNHLKNQMEKNKDNLTTEEIVNFEKYIKILNAMLDPEHGILTLAE